MHLASSANRRIEESNSDEGRSLTNIMKKSGPRMLPQGTPDKIGRRLDAD